MKHVSWEAMAREPEPLPIPRTKKRRRKAKTITTKVARLRIYSRTARAQRYRVRPGALISEVICRTKREHLQELVT